MNTTKEHHYWMFQITTLDCAGALTGVAAAFSNQGISIQTITGHGIRSDQKGIIEVGFESDEQTKDILVRKIKRLTKVIRFQEVSPSPKKPSGPISA